MSMQITVKDAAIQYYLARLQARMADLEPVMDSIGHALEQNIRRRYQTRKDPNGNPWKDWSKNTKKSYPWRGSKAAKRSKDGAGRGKILERYGAMFDGISTTTTKTSVTVGFNQPYAAYHEWGTKHMPRRGLLYAYPSSGKLGQKDRQTVLAVLHHYLQQA